MKRNQNNNISFGDYDNKGSRKLLPILLIVLILLAVAAGGYFGYKFVSARRNAVVSIEVTQMPKKTIYFIGDEAEYKGLEVTATRKNGKTFVVSLDESEISGFSSDRAMESRIIRIDYSGCQTFFSVEVREQPVEAAILESISMETLPKTQYKLGEWLDTNGGRVKIEYKNKPSRSLTLTNSMVSGFSKITSPGTYTLTVKYKENGIIATTTYTITVTE